MTASLLLAILATGALLSWWVVARADSEMRADLLEQTRMLAQAIDTERVQALTGTDADLDKPDYQRLKEQFATIRSANPLCRFIYLLGRKGDGSLFFFIDSEPTDSKDYSPPGQAYDEASEGCRRVFATRNEAVEGPVADRWGKWVSALVPILDPQTAMYGLATPQDAHAMVLKAVDFYQKNGRERLLEEVDNPEGEFCKGDLYAFVYDRDMTWLAHPKTPDLVGKNRINEKDWSGGKYFRKEMQQVAQSPGSGWVEYEYLNPINGHHDHKTTYVQGLGDLIVCSGSYKGTGEILAVLGMDVDARAWNWMLARAALPSGLLTLALLTLLFLGSSLLARRSRLASAPPRWMRHLEPALALAVGLALTLFGAWMARESENRNRKAAFTQLAESQTEAVAEMLHSLRFTELEGVASYYEGSEQITAEEFRRYARYLSKNPAVSAWEWIPVVLDADKSRFEDQTRAAGLKNFEVWQKDAQGKRMPASGREVYYPVFQVAPLAGNERALGYDLGSDPVRSAALEEAARTGLATGTDPITLVQDTGKQKSLLVCRPVFNSGDSKLVRGFALAALRMGTLLRSAAPGNPAFMDISFLRKGADAELLANAWDADSPPATGLSETRPVLAFGKTFDVTAHAGPGFMRMHPVQAGWLAILTGTVLSVALAAVIRVSLRRHEELEQMVGELRESKTMLQVVLDTIPNFLCWKDRNSAYLGCNRSFASMAGLPGPESIVGMTDRDLPWAKEETEFFIGDDSRVMVADKADYHVVEPALAADGKRMWLESSKVPLHDADGRVSGILVASEDITERKRAEEEKSSLQDQLAQSQKMESVGRLAGGVAHDFNNMLQVILISADVALSEAAPDSPLAECLQAIKEAGQRSASLTRQLLAFARKQAITPEVLDLNDAVTGTLKMLRRLIGEDIELIWKPGSSQWQVNMDPAQVDQILANLVVNARDAIANVGQVTIETDNVTLDAGYCETNIGAAPGEYVLLAVSDSGCGMDRETQAKIFEPFFTTKEQGKGTGLGLATVYGIVKQNNGFVNVYSELGRGTTFRIYLRRHQAEESLAGAAPEAEALPRGSGTVLLVEDEARLLNLVRPLLQDLGYTVLAANTPQEAIRLFEDHPGSIQLLLTDVVMPKMNGRDLWQHLSAIRPTLRCLFMSGYTADVIAHQGVLDEGVAFIAKPFSASDLHLAIRKALNTPQKAA